MMQREVDCACILEDTVCESLRIPPATKKPTRREAKRILPKTPRSAPMEPSPRIASALDVLRRVPPFDLKQNATALCTLLPPDPATDPDGRAYLRTEHNRHGDSHRSPWSNQYVPIANGPVPSGRLRDLEALSNELFSAYRDLYYGGNSVSSVYLWEAPGAWFEGAFYVQNVVEERRWDAVHVARATGEGIGRYEL